MPGCPSDPTRPSASAPSGRACGSSPTPCRPCRWTSTAAANATPWPSCRRCCGPRRPGPASTNGSTRSWSPSCSGGTATGSSPPRSGATLLPAQVDLAHPDRMTVTTLPDGRVQYRLNGKELDPADVWHVRAYPFPGAVLGLSPVEYARQTIGLGLAAEKFAGQFFADPVPTGVLYADRDPKHEGAKKLQAEWMAARKT